MPIPDEVVDWVRRLRPSHKCSAEIFRSVVCHGMVMCRAMMAKLKDPDKAALIAMQIPAVTK